LADLRNVKEAVRVPVLRKDFIFDPYQVYEARAAGADALLLIVSVLGDNDLRSLLKLTHELDMNALIEVHTEAELERALAVQPRIVGINNRNLQTFEVDFDNTARLRQRIPPEVVVVGESGVKTAEHVQTLAQIGVDAILVGETLVTSKDPFKTARMLVQAGRT
jgi:indole-3-glycerol phosphate synthase